MIKPGQYGTLVVGDVVTFDFDKPMTPEERAKAVLILGLPVVEAMESGPKTKPSYWEVTVSDKPWKAGR